MIVIYKNKSEQSFEFSQKNNVGIVSISGLDIPTPEYERVTFAKENGTTTVGKRDLMRTITMSIDVHDTKGIIRRKMNRVIHEEGNLIFITKNGQRRKISAKIGKAESNPMGAGYFSYVLQFDCDYPYFSDIYPNESFIFNRRNLVSDTFTLPCVFTERSSYADIFNMGDKYVYPKIIIENIGQADSSDTVLTVLNETTGAFIKMNHQWAVGEVLTFDLETRKIVSSISGNVTKKMTDDTEFSKFYYEVGKNIISCESTSLNALFSAKSLYDSEYYSVEV